MHSRTALRACGLVFVAWATWMCAPRSQAPAPSASAPPPPVATSTSSSARAGGAQSARRVSQTAVPAARPPAYPQRQVAPPEELARGHQLFQGNCSFCHGSDARGGETGPNLVLSKLVLDDQHGEVLTPVVQNGFPAQGMPKFTLTPAEISAIASWLHAQPLSDRGSPSKLDVLVGKASAGEAYFNGAGGCRQCHSVTGDLAGIGARYDPKTIQNLIVSGGRARGAPGGGPSRSAAPANVPPTTVTITLPSGERVTGTLDHITAFVVALKTADSTYHSFARHGATPTVVVHNPLQWHLDMLPRWRDADIHDLTAYLATLK